MTLIKTAVIGIGSMGKKYAKMLYNNEIEGLQLTSVVCRSADNIKWAEENLKGVKIFSNEEALYDSKECDAVIISTPHKSHPELTISALKHNLSVMCDKPSGTTVNDAEEMENAGKYAVMFHNRTYPVIKKLKELLSANTVGKINRILLENTESYRTAFYHNSSNWRSSWKGEGGGMLINQGQHIIDYWVWLFGMPKSIYANISYGKYNDFKVDDEAVITMDYGDYTGTFIMSTGEIQPRNYISVIGDMGRITVENDVIILEKNSCSAMDYSKNANINTRDNLNYTTEEFICSKPENPYHTMLENFRDNILYKKELIADGTDGKNALIITNGAYMSSWLGKKIDLPIDGNKYENMLIKVMDNE